MPELKVKNELGQWITVRGNAGPRGPKGDANTLQVGTVDSTTGDPSVEIVGDAPSQTVNFLLKEGPQGPQGLNGPQGIQGLKGDKGDPGVGMVSGGATGQVLRKASSANHDAVWDDDIGAAFAIDAEPQINQLVSDVDDVSIKTDVLAALRFDPEHPNYGAVRGLASVEPIPFVKAQNRAAIQLAADDARDTGGTLVLKGVYWVDTELQFNCHVDGAAGQLLYSDINIPCAVLVGTRVSGAPVHRLQVTMPQVLQMATKVAGSWGASIGVEVANTNSCTITSTHILNFGTNLLLTGIGEGNAYNNYFVGHLSNGKINMRLSPGTGGWVNENTFYGGRYSHFSSEGTNVTGVRHIVVDTATHVPNNNLWIKPSIEGNTPEYHVEAGGAYNKITQARWEASPAKLRWVSGAHSWVIEDGYGAQSLQITAEAGAGLYCRVITRDTMSWYALGGTGGVLRLAARASSNDPVLTVYRAGDTFWSRNFGTSWQWSLSSNALKGKAEADTHPRIELQPDTGRILLGNGTSAPTLAMHQPEPGLIAFANGNRAYFDGGWQKPFYFGQMRLWNNSGTLYKKNGSDPVSATDGTVIG